MRTNKKADSGKSAQEKVIHKQYTTERKVIKCKLLMVRW